MVKVPNATAPVSTVPSIVEEEKTDTLDSILKSESDADVPNENGAAPNAEHDGTEPTGEGAAPATTEGAATTPATRTSTKTREARNVPDGYTTTWVPIDIPNAESLILKRAAKIGKTTVAEMLSVELTPAYVAAKPKFKEEADKFVPTRATAVDKLDTPEAIAAAQAKLDKMKTAEAKLAAAIAARLAQKGQTAPVVEEKGEDDDDENDGEDHAE